MGSDDVQTNQKRLRGGFYCEADSCGDDAVMA